MYTFTDKANRSLTLRPENTPPVVRAALEHNLLHEIFPLRFYYIGPMFRYDKPQKGRYRQFHQFGAEVFGDPTPEVDAEVIYSAYGFLREIRVGDIELLINSVGCRECRPPYLKLLKKAAQAVEDRLCGDCRRKVHTNPLRIFDCKVETCKALSRDFPSITDHLCQECGDHFSVVKESLKNLGVGYTLNPRLVRGLDYYTKTAFEITSGRLGAQDSLLGGGRYNNLIQELGGTDIPGMGFAAGMERIILHLDSLDREKSPAILIAYQTPAIRSEAMRLGQHLWDRGFTAYIEYNAKNMKKQFRQGNRIGAGFTFILGEDELANQTVSIKDMKTQEQTQIKREGLDQWLKENL
jgi:histidyl-tRNA synthetase